MNKIINHGYIVLLFFCLLSFWPMLICTGVFWDDCCSYGHDIDVLKSAGLQLTGGNPLRVYIGYFLLKIDPNHIFLHYIQFILIYTRIIIFYYILKNLPVFSKLQTEAFIIALLAVVCPVNFSKFSGFMFTQELYVFGFFLGAFFLQKYFLTKCKSYIILSVFFLIYSCDYPSVCPFYYMAIPILIYQHTHDESINTFDNILRIAKKYFILWLIPISVFLINRKVFTPYGIYEGYNAVHALSLPKIINSLINNITFPIILLTYTYQFSGSLYMLTFIISFIVSIFILKESFFEYIKKESLITLILLSFSLYIASMLAYIALGRHLVYAPEYTRDQILVNFTFGTMLWYIVKYLIKFKYNNVIAALIISLFCAANVSGYIGILKNNVYKEAFILSLKNYPEIQIYSTIVIYDIDNVITDWNHDKCDTEYISMFKSAYNKASFYCFKYNFSKSDINIMLKKISSNKYICQSIYPDWNPNGKFCKLILRMKHYENISTPTAIRWTIGRLFGKDVDYLINDMFAIEIVPGASNEKPPT